MMASLPARLRRLEDALVGQAALAPKLDALA
jgi:hypothetical protein